jgi:hypothetical protein
MTEAPLQAIQNHVVAHAHTGLATHTVSPTRKKIALGIAATADLLQLGFFPIFGEGVLSIPDDVLDAVVAVALLVTLGFKWRILLALGIELVPGIALFPSWTAVVLTLPTHPAPKELPKTT